MTSRLLLPLVAAFVLGGCAHRATPGQAQKAHATSAQDRPGATVTLRAAVITRAPVVTRVSCQGGGLCRESTFSPEDAEEIDEAKEDCAERRGRLGTAPCPRDGALVACSGSGTRVVAYAQDDRAAQEDAVSAITDLCELHGGSLEPQIEGAL